MHPYIDRPVRSRKLAWLPATLLAAALAAGGFVPDAHAQEEFDDADIFFELNNTDGDLGIHALIDGDAWKRLRIRDPEGRLYLDVKARSRLRRQGLTEFFFESAEPVFEELSPEAFFARFPEGEYVIEGITVDGEELESETEVTHTMPAPPVPTVNGAPLAIQCDPDEPFFDAPEVSPPIVISWPPVTISHPDLGTDPQVPVTIHNYQLVVEADVDVGGEDLEASHSVILPPDVTELPIPDEFIALSDEFKYEVLVREESFNQTATESCFLIK